MWVIIRTLKRTDDSSVQRFEDRAAALAEFMREFDWARKHGRLLHFELDHATGAGVLEEYAVWAVLAEVPSMGGLSDGGSSESEGVTGTRGVTGSEGVTGIRPAWVLIADTYASSAVAWRGDRGSSTAIVAVHRYCWAEDESRGAERLGTLVDPSDHALEMFLSCAVCGSAIDGSTTGGAR